jgi:hypothetical protein
VKWLLIILALSCEARDLRWEYAKRGNQDVTSGLVGQWKFNGDATDSVGTNNGVTANSPAYVPWTATRQAIRLNDGAFRTVSLTGFSMTNASYTITLWAYSRTNSLNAFNAYPFDSETGRFTIGWGSAGAPNQIGVSPGGSTWLNFGTSPAAGAWRHIGVVVASTNVSFFLDGAIYGSPQVGVYRALGGKIAIGSRYSQDSYPFTGDVADFRIYNRALTPAEIGRIYRSTK